MPRHQSSRISIRHRALASFVLLVSGVLAGNAQAQVFPATLTNTATLTVPDDVTDSNSANNSASDIDTLQYVRLAKTVSAPSVPAASSYSYTLTLTNDSGASVSNVVVRDDLPTGVIATAVSGANCGSLPSAAGALLTCTVPGPIAASGGTASFTLTVTAPVTSGAITNYAATHPAGSGNPISAPGAACDTATTSCASVATTVTASADVSVIKTGPASVSAGGAISFTLVVSNAGPSAANNTVLTDPAVANFTATGISCGSPTGGAVCPAGPSLAQLQGAGVVIPTLPSGGSVTFTLSGTAGNAASISNTASVTPPGGTSDPDGSDDGSTAVVPVLNVVNAVDDSASTPVNVAVITSVLTNDTSARPALVPASVSVTVASPNGSAVANANGAITFTPSAGFSGVTTYTYQVCDNSAPAVCDTAVVSVTVVDSQPIAVNDNASTSEDTVLNASVAGNDTASADGGNVWTLVGANGGASNGTVTMNPDGSYSYTPAANFNGSDSFSYALTDADGDVSTATVSVTVIAVDDLPVAVNDTTSTNEDAPVSASVAGNDTPSADGGNVWALVGANGGAANGTVSMDAAGAYTYTPNANFNGSDSFSYSLTDADGDVSTATVSVTVTAVDDLPIAVNDSISTNEDAPVSASVAGNDTPSADGGNVWALVGANGGAVNGTVSMDAAGAYTYTPTANFSGSDSFSYTLTDADGDVSTATVSVTVTAVDDLPIAVNDSISTNEDAPVNGNVSTNDTASADGGNVWALVGANGGATNGTVSMDVAGAYTYTPNANFSGSDSFSYALTDADGDVSTATVAVTVTAVDDLPVAVNDTIGTNEDVPVSGNVSGNDTASADGGNVWALVAANGGAANGTVSMDAAGAYTYTPAANFSGSDSFNYSLTDADGDVSTATVAVTVTAVDDLPVAVNDTIGTNEDVPVSGNVSSNDTASADGGNVWTLVGANGGAANGTVSMDAAGAYTYTPAANFSGTDSFSYTLTDADGDVSSATVIVTVTAVDDLPVAVNDSITTSEDAPVSGSVSTNDTASADGGNAWALVGANGGAANGTVSMDAAGAYTYTPNANFSGSDSFSYSLTDTDGDVSTATVAVTVTAVDDLPVAVNDTISTNEDAPASGNVSTNDTASADGGNVWTLVGANGGATNGTVSMDLAGAYTYTPNTNFNGSDSFSYTLADADGDVSTATVSVIITAVDDLPVAVNDTTSTNEDAPVSGNVSGNDTASADGGNVWALVGANGGAANGTVSMDAVGAYTYTPAANFSGSDSFSYTLTDADGDVSTATMSVTVTAGDDLPVAVNDTISTNEDAPVNGNVSINDTASADGGNAWTLVGANGGATNGTVSMDLAGAYTYTPSANFNGSDSFSYTLTDADGDVSTATVAITVTAVDDLPVAVNDTISTNEDAPVSGNVSTNDTASADGGNVWTLVGANGGATNGTVSMDVAGAYTYTPNANFNGSDSFSYTLTDADGDVVNATVSVTVTPVADVVNAQDDAATTPQNTGVTTPAIANDTASGPALNPGSVTVTVPGNGTTTVNPDGSITFTPTTGFSGTTTYTYQVCDTSTPTTVCDTAVVTVVVGSNTITATDDTTSVPQNGSVTTPVIGNDTTSGAPINPGSVTVTVPGSGTTTVNPDGSVTFVPTPGFSGTTTYTYQVCDTSTPTPVCDTAVVTVVVGNNTITATDDTTSVPQNGSVTTPVIGNDTTSGAPINPGSVTVTVPGNGTTTVNPDGSVTFVPTPGFSGTTTYTYQVCDSSTPTPVCDTAVVTVTVGSNTVTPTDDTSTAPSNTPVTTPVLVNDTSTGAPLDPGSVTVTAPPSSGTTSVDPVTGAIIYTPASGFTGTVSYTYQVCDTSTPTPVCGQATVTVNVTQRPINADDDAAPGAVNGANGGVAITNVWSNDTLGNAAIVPGSVTTTLVTQATHVNVSMDVNTGVVTVGAGTPVGDYTITYRICEIATPANCDTATATVSVVAAPIDAIDDDYRGTPVQYDTTAWPGNAVGNDRLAGQIVPMDSVIATVLVPATVSGITLDTNTGGVRVEAGTPAGTYTIDYRLCERLNPGNCDTARITAVVLAQGDLIELAKTAEQRELKPGDLVRYTVTVRNRAAVALNNQTIVDTLPAGFSFVEGSLTVRDRDGAFSLRGTSPLTIDGIDLELGGTATVSYSLRAGAGVRAGTHINRVIALTNDGQPISNEARAEVRVGGDPMIDNSLILGSVFDDRDGDGWQDPAKATGLRVQGLSGNVQVERDGQRVPAQVTALGVELGHLDGRNSVADIARRVVIHAQAATGFVLTTAEGTTVRVDAAGQASVQTSGDAAKGLTAQALNITRTAGLGTAGATVTWTIENVGIDERGIPGVRIASVEGLVMETDAHGRYHLEGVEGGEWSRGRNFILKVDAATLPKGTGFTTENPRVRRITPGLPVRFDFGVKLPQGEGDGGKRKVSMELGQVFFEAGSAAIREEYRAAIVKMTEQVRHHGGGEVDVKAEGENYLLAMDRAMAVRKALVAQLEPALAANLKVTVSTQVNFPDKLVLGFVEWPLLGSVVFDTNKTSIKPKFLPLIHKMAEAIAQMESTRIAIVGHADVRGDREANAKLGIGRAQAVYDAIIDAIPPEQRGRFRVDLNEDTAAPVGENGK